jgi:transposase
LEFKRQAVSLAEELGSAPKAAEQLGVPESNIHNWREKLKASDASMSLGSAIPRKAAPTESPDEELRRLRRENQELKKVNHILKAAAAFFSQDHLK